MPLKLMYITNRPDVALIAEKNGVDRVFVDMEYIGKSKRQGGMDSVQNHHTVEDIHNLRKVLTKADLLVRINPIHEESPDYSSTEKEIEEVIAAGADIIMLPFFKSADEVRRFVKDVDRRCRTILLLETPEAVSVLDEILEISGIDEIHIGINDLCIGYGKKFMFELLTDGTVEYLCLKMRNKDMTYGFGGIAQLGKGLVPAEMIIKEHYRLGSSMVILSRSFCNTDKVENISAIDELFSSGIKDIRSLEEECQIHTNYFMDNRDKLVGAVAEVVK